MRPLTDDEFLAFLDDEVAWRRSELHVLRMELREATKSPGSPRERALARSLSLMVYAHWEGYVKTSFDKLTTILSKRKPSVSSVADPFALSHLKHLLTRLNSGDSQATKELMSLVRGDEAAPEMRLKLRKDELVKTRDNLRFEYFEEIVKNFGIDVAAFDLTRQFVNSKLCDQRNVVAHGQGSFPDAKSVEESVEKVLELISRLRDLQGDLLAEKRYLATETKVW